MPLYDWLLFLHVLAGAAIVAALVLFGAAVLGARKSERPSAVASSLDLARLGGVLFDVGGTAILVLGIWLAFEADYGLGEPWIVAAIVLWVVAAGAGARARRRYLATRSRAGELERGGDHPDGELAASVRDRTAFALYVAAAAAVFLMLLLMVFKPGTGS
ncbi:MAG: DUF2269 family protein [Thermoleophilia bacterium]|nr:DUF2269 family protein [Thermoleophilia bacterium]